MIQVRRYDHISMAVPVLDPQIELMTRLLGFRFGGTFENEDGYVGANLDIPGSNSIGWELIAPRGEDSYLRRFLAGPSGAGLHHIAVQVDSVTQAAETLQAAGLEAWGYRGADEAADGRGVVYLHPRSGGRGLLWQIYAGEPWHTSQPFEDHDESTVGIVGVNHVAHATWDRSGLADWYERLFGCETVWVSAPNARDAGVRTRVLETSTRQFRFEMVEPAGQQMPVSRFLNTRGEGMHHVAFEVADWARAMGACRKQGVLIFGERTGERQGARWSEAFLHPRSMGGVLIQLFWQERPGTWI